MEIKGNLKVNNLIKGVDDELCSLHEAFFLCLKNSFRLRGIDLDLEGLYQVSKYLTEPTKEGVLLYPDNYVKEIPFEEKEGVLKLNLMSITDLLDNSLDSKYLNSYAVSDYLLNVLGEYACRILMRETQMPLEVSLGNIYSSSSQFYIKFLSTCRLLPWLENFITLHLTEEVNRNIDINLEEYLLKANAMGTLRNYTIDERVKIFKEEFKAGMIVSLMSRYIIKNYIHRNQTPVGHIDGVKLVKILGLEGNTVHYEAYNCVISKAESLRSYYQIDEDKQHLFRDLENPKVSVTRGTADLYTLALNNHIAPFDSEILCYFNPREIVKKEFFTDDGLKELTLTAPECVYKLLEEYGVEFDRVLFKKMYHLENM